MAKKKLERKEYVKTSIIDKLKFMSNHKPIEKVAKGEKKDEGQNFNSTKLETDEDLPVFFKKVQAISKVHMQNAHKNNE